MGGLALVIIEDFEDAIVTTSIACIAEWLWGEGFAAQRTAQFGYGKRIIHGAGVRFGSYNYLAYFYPLVLHKRQGSPV